MRRVILVSGGIDSTVAYHLYMNMSSEDVNIPVFIDYGQEYSVPERLAVRRVGIPNVQEMKIEIDPSSTVFVPARNLTFASAIASAYNPDEIIIAGLRDDIVVDKTPEAFIEMSSIISKFSKKRITVKSPFWEKSKGEIVSDFIGWHPGAENILKKCFSCYTPKRVELDAVPCGSCPACFRRYVSFVTNGISDEFDNISLVTEYLSKIHTYDSDRQSRIFSAAKNFFSSIQAFDIDGILAIETDGHDYVKRTLSNYWKERINESFNQNDLVVMYTARYECDRNVTTNWLKTNGIFYHSLIMGKVPYDVLVDDRAHHVFLQENHER